VIQVTRFKRKGRDLIDAEEKTGGVAENVAK
jgi:hypothetical protein